MNGLVWRKTWSWLERKIAMLLFSKPCLTLRFKVLYLPNGQSKKQSKNPRKSKDFSCQKTWMTTYIITWIYAIEVPNLTVYQDKVDMYRSQVISDINDMFVMPRFLKPLIFNFSRFKNYSDRQVLDITHVDWS